MANHVKTWSRRAGRAGCSAAAATVVLLAAGCSGGGSPSARQTAAPPARTYDQYVALGDSYTSAPGVPEQREGLCAQSTANYPHLLAAKLGADLVDRSCGGAAIWQLIAPFRPETPAQIDAVTADTDLVTLSIGANPWAFGMLVNDCVWRQSQGGEAPCRQAMSGTMGDQIVGKILAQRDALTAVVRRIRATAPKARVVLVGYPAVFPATGSCGDRLPLSPGDVAYADSVLRSLNAELERAARTTGSDYLDVYAATRGHDICADDAWIQGKESEEGVAVYYHPRAAEQRAVADLLLRLLR